MDRLNRTKLHYVAIDFPESEHEAKILELVNAGLDPNNQDKNGWTPLHFAAQGNSISAVRALIKCGANTEVKDVFGNTPLFRAVFSSNGNGDIINFLIEDGADPESKNKHDVSPKSLAESIGNYDITKFFK
ncbi:ankyrin repeat domain-containing protein [Microbulbifer elongatus]|uniref:Ankyrin repeat domain-containing protein n=2 Tax=Microbulbifer elongatus TaxID=86173 RepID=A0ABT1NZ30_9GAMM|nr:ankyrin repeat domain-containing protein [Microbulbifer elongatus]MCQ3829148.1 ankyrin repeat domain-containing protein [Microbulbifer elongatus]